MPKVPKITLMGTFVIFTKKHVIGVNDIHFPHFSFQHSITRNRFSKISKPVLYTDFLCQKCSVPFPFPFTPVCRILYTHAPFLYLIRTPYCIRTSTWARVREVYGFQPSTPHSALNSHIIWDIDRTPTDGSLLRWIFYLLKLRLTGPLDYRLNFLLLRI